jgi:hypothetical protein
MPGTTAWLLPASAQFPGHCPPPSFRTRLGIDIGHPHRPARPLGIVGRHPPSPPSNNSRHSPPAYSKHSNNRPEFPRPSRPLSTLLTAGWQPPEWAELIEPSHHPLPNPEPMASRGWQRRATKPAHARCRTDILGSIDPAGQAMFQSQAGPCKQSFHIPMT